MKPEDKRQLRGAKDLLQSAVEHGASAVERVQMETAARPFALLEQVPPLRAPARRVRAVHDGLVALSYANVRSVTRLVGRVVGAAIDALPQEEDPLEPSKSGASGDPTEPPA